MSKKKIRERIVNPYWLTKLWVCASEGRENERLLGGGSIFDPERLNILCTKLLPPLLLDLQRRGEYECVKETFKYAISFWPDTVLEHALLAILPAFIWKEGDDIRKLYVTVWTAMFPLEPYRLDSRDGYVESHVRDVDCQGRSEVIRVY